MVFYLIKTLFLSFFMCIQLINAFKTQFVNYIHYLILPFRWKMKKLRSNPIVYVENAIFVIN